MCSTVLVEARCHRLPSEADGPVPGERLANAADEPVVRAIDRSLKVGLV